MNAITLAKLQLKEMLRQPLAWVVLFMMPFALVGFLLYGLDNVMTSKTILPPFKVAIVDQDDTVETSLLLQQFQDDEELEALITFQHVGLVEAKTLLSENKVASILKIPKGFTNGLQNGKNHPVTVINNPQRPFQSALFLEMMKSAADLVSAAQSGVNTVYAYLKDEASIGSQALREETIASIKEFTLFTFSRGQMYEKKELASYQGVTPMDYYSVSAFIFLLSLTGLLTISMNSLSNHRIEDRLRTFGVSVGAQIGSQFIQQIAVLFLQALLLLASLATLTDVKVTGELDWGLLSIGAALLVISSWYTMLSNLPISEGIRFFLGMVGLIIFTVVGSLLLPASYYTGLLAWMNKATVTHWIHTSLIHSLFITNKDVLITSLKMIAGMSVVLLFTSYMLRRRKQV